jgi:hypothetical protein
MNPYLLPGLEAGPLVIRRLLRQIPASRLDEPLTADRFTPREVIAHLADWEPIMRDRIAAGRAHPGSTIEAYDEGAMAQDHDYAHSDPTVQCDIFERERSLTLVFVRILTAGDWDKTVMHPERGPLSVADLANLLLGHDLYHIEQLSAYLPTER